MNDELRAILLTYIRIYGDISLIMIDTHENEIIWYNKSLYLNTKKAIICANEMYLLYFENTKIYNFYPELNLSNVLECINGMALLEDFVEPVAFEQDKCHQHSQYSALVALSNSKKLPIVISKNVKKTKPEELQEYLNKYYEKISYVMC